MGDCRQIQFLLIDAESGTTLSRQSPLELSPSEARAGPTRPALLCSKKYFNRAGDERALGSLWRVLEAGFALAVGFTVNSIR